jgi:hypothetical protein
MTLRTRSVGLVLCLSALAVLTSIHSRSRSEQSKENEPITAEVILERWTEALGGRDRLQRVKNTHTKSVYEGTAGTGTIEEWSTSNGRRRQSNDLTTGHEINIFAVSTGWISRDGQVRELSPAEIEGARTPAYIGSYSHLIAGRLPGSAEYLGEDDSKQNYVLRVAPQGGRPSRFYIDKITYLPTRYEEQLTTTLLIIRFNGWREVTGIKLPVEMHMSANDGAYEATATLQEAQFNMRLDRDLFKRPAEGPKDYRFVSGRSALRLPIEEDTGHIFLSGRINNSGPLWFAIDTAASRSLIDGAFAQSLGLQLLGDQQITGAGGSVPGSYAREVSLRLPGVELRHQTLSTLSLDFLAQLEARKIPVILGYDLFSRFVVEIDYAAKYINLFDPQSYRYRGSGEIIPITLHNNQPYLRAKLVLPGRAPIESEYVVDTGSSRSLMLAKAFAAEQNVLASVGKTVQGSARGVGGETPLVVGRVSALQLGQFTITNPITLFPAGEIVAPGKAGNIGGNILRRFRVIFDYLRHRLILEPNEHFSEVDEYDMSGASLSLLGLADQAIKVTRIIENSPAAEVGLKPEDILLTIDGRPTAEIGLSRIREMFKQEGREYQLNIKRGAEMLQLRLKLRKLI